MVQSFKFKSVPKTLLCFLLVLYGGCSAPIPHFESQFDGLRADMAQDQVKELLGPPDLKELKDHIETWHYGKDSESSHARYVQFTERKVTGFGREQSLWAPLPAPSEKSDQISRPLHSKLISESCKQDDECQSANCHFKVCAGKNNCTLNAGQVCGTDNDCCTGLCDFGICRVKK